MAFERFDPNLMVKEVHEMTETLIKIRAGTLSYEQFDAINFDSHVFHQAQHGGGHNNRHSFEDEYYDEIYGDYYGEEDHDDYGIGSHRVI